MSDGPTVGRVYLAGAGPGSLDLVTLRARELIEEADVIVYDYLCNPDMLRWARSDAEQIYAGKSGASHTLTQDEINALLVEKARAGKTVVRLKGGDPYVFGRGGEEALVLGRAGVPFEVVPGVTSAIAAPCYAGIPVTHRDIASTVTFVTGHENPTKPDSAIDWKHLAGLRGTKIFLMGVERLGEITQRLIAEGADPATPVALVRWGTTARQESVSGTLADIAGEVARRGFAAPAVTIIGGVVGLRPELNWYEQLPLFGQRIVVTRTRTQASDLTRRLIRLGADVLEIPTIRIEPMDLDESQRNRMAQFSSLYDWLVFTSPNGVEHFFAAFFSIHSDLRELGKVKIAAVGPATSRKIKEMHLQVDLQPAKFTSETLAECFVGRSIQSQRFCLPCGDLSDCTLANRLGQLGGQVQSWPLYRTRPETGDATGAMARYKKEGAHWITFSSSSTVENWHALQLETAPGAPRPGAVSLGPLTSATLRKLGYNVVAESPDARVTSLVATLRRLNQR